MPSRRRLWISYALIVGSLSLAVLEGGVRLLGLARPLPEQYSLNVADPFVPWRKVPNSVAEDRTDEFAFSYRHNTAGFRDLERSTEKPAGVYRILALGDSFTYGVGAAFEETFPRRLEGLLNVSINGRPPVEVVNAGVPGYWPAAERLMLEHYGFAYSPDLVLVAFLPNDVLDTHQEPVGVDTGTGFLVRRGHDGAGALRTWLFVRSHLFRALLASFARVGDWARGLRIDDVDRDEAAREAAWVKIEQEYTRMAALASAHAARMAVVFIPQKGPWRAASSDEPQRRLARWAAAHGALFVDTKPALRAAWDSAPLYYPVDGHCTPAGYAVIARTIATALLSSPAFDRAPAGASGP